MIQVLTEICLRILLSQRWLVAHQPREKFFSKAEGLLINAVEIRCNAILPNCGDCNSGELRSVLQNRG